MVACLEQQDGVRFGQRNPCEPRRVTCDMCTRNVLKQVWGDWCSRGVVSFVFHYIPRIDVSRRKSAWTE